MKGRMAKSRDKFLERIDVIMLTTLWIVLIIILSPFSFLAWLFGDGSLKDNMLGLPRAALYIIFV